MTPDEMDEVVTEFLVESHENIDALDRALLVLESNPGDRETLSAIFRSIHTIKGASGFLGFDRLTSLTHVAESLLSGLRDGTLTLTPQATSALFSTVDAVRTMLRTIESQGDDGTDDYAALAAELSRLQHPEAAPVVAEPAEAESASEGPDAVEPAPDEPVTAPAEPVAAAPAEPVAAAPAEPVAAPVGPVTVGPVAVGPVVAVPAPAPVVAAVPVEAVAPVVAAAEPDAVPVADDAEGDSGSPAGRQGAPEVPALDQVGAASASTIRVGVSLLDKLMNLVGELVLARNQILQCTTGQTDATFTATAQRLNLITTELQEGVMKTRMQPIGTIWNKFPRVVRDLSLICGKQIRLDMEGAETELDRTLIEAITDPLTHLVRNAVDHGVESAEARTAAGKSAQGRLSLRAYHEGGHVNIEIADDGAGIDVSRVREKARAKGLLRGGDEGRMSERELMGLIFAPGFSTAPAVTDISGRGVGLDVVKTNIERIGGTVDVTSERGVGTTFRVKIPLTLAIIPALIVTTGGDRYAIPQVNLVELVRLKDELSSSAIEYVHGVPVHRLRGNLLPLVDLAGELGLRDPASTGLGRDGTVSIVVLQALDRQFGLVVDDISDTEEIVVKPLGQQLKQVETFAGATIMGDGRVALILDVMGVAHRAGVVSEVSERAGDEKASAADGADGAQTETLLVVGVGGRRRMAIHLSAVNRLEEFDEAELERAGGTEVVQYRGRILPLIRVGSLVDGPLESSGSDRLQVVVHDDGRETVGLVVDQILDIVEETVLLDRGRPGRGLLGSAIVQGRVTDVVDVPALVAMVTGRPAALVVAA